MQCKRLVLAAETRTRAYYTSMCELQHPLAPGKVGTDLGFSQSESGRLCLRMSGPSCPLNFAELNPFTLREWIYSLLW